MGIFEQIKNNYRNIRSEVSSDSQLRFFLPPVNEVWSQVMFLHLSVILFTGGGGSP